MKTPDRGAVLYILLTNRVVVVSTPMRRYAFVDVQNTASTTEKMLGFVVDWARLVEYLKNKKSCTAVYLYTGIDNGDTVTASEFEALSKIPCVSVKSKSVFAYKRPDKIFNLDCSGCGTRTLHKVPGGYRRKSNCDVELSVDVMEMAGPDVEILLYTGDGDFEYLARKALEKGATRVTFVSYAGRDVQAGMTNARYSTKLRALVAEKPAQVFYTSLVDGKDQFSKVI